MTTLDLHTGVRPVEHPGVAQMRHIITVTAEFLNVPVPRILGQDRRQSANFARAVAMHCCRALTNASLHEIGHVFGRHHTTVLHNVREMRRRLNVDEQSREWVDSILIRACGENLLSQM